MHHRLKVAVVSAVGLASLMTSVGYAYADGVRGSDDDLTERCSNLDAFVAQRTERIAARRVSLEEAKTKAAAATNAKQRARLERRVRELERKITKGERRIADTKAACANISTTPTSKPPITTGITATTVPAPTTTVPAATTTTIAPTTTTTRPAPTTTIAPTTTTRPAPATTVPPVATCPTGIDRCAANRVGGRPAPAALPADPAAIRTKTCASPAGYASSRYPAASPTGVVDGAAANPAGVDPYLSCGVTTKNGVTSLWYAVSFL